MQLVSCDCRDHPGTAASFLTFPSVYITAELKVWLWYLCNAHSLQGDALCINESSESWL